MDIFNYLLILVLIDISMEKLQSFKFIVTPKNMTVNIGDNISFECTASGSSFYYTWEYKSQKDTTNRDGIVLGFCYRGQDCVVKLWNDQIQITNSSQLIIRNITSDKSGQYFCETTPANGYDIIKTSAWIFVKTPPKSISITLNKTQNTFLENESVDIKCSAIGSNPAPKVVISMVESNKISYHLKIEPSNEPLSNTNEVNVHALWRPRYSQHQGFIMCTANNDAGHLSHNSSQLNIKFRPKIVPFKSDNISARVGQTIDLTCVTIANPPATVHWFINNGLRQIASSQLITKVQSEMAGNLTCVAENSIGTSNRSLRLVVLKDPVILIEKQYKVREHSDTTIVCQVDAIPEPDFIKWYKLSTDSNSFLTVLSNDAKLNFINIDRSSTGKYACVTKNTQRPTDGEVKEITVKKYIEITVTYLPGLPLIKSDNEIKIQKGDPLRVSCFVNSKSPGEPFPDLSWIDVDTRNTASHSHEMVVEKAGSINSGNYQCAAKNDLGISLSSKTVIVTVNEAPIIASHNQSIVFLSYSLLPQYFDFTCTFQGHPLSTVNWYYQRSRITSDLNYEITMNRSISREKATMLSSNLTIKLYSPRFSLQINSKLPPSGVYSCETSNRLGTASYDYSLIIKYPPLIKIKPHEQKVAGSLGQDFVSIKCQIESIDELQIAWFRVIDRMELSNMDRKYSIINTDIIKYNAETDVFAPGIKITELRILDLLLGDFTGYTCVATNDQGTNKGTVELVFKSKPDVPYDVKVTNTEWDSVTIVWKSGFNGGIEQSFEIHVFSDMFGPQNVPYYTDKIENKLTLKGLHPNNNYSIQLYAVNIIGRSAGSSIIACVTKRISKFDNIHARIVSDQPKVVIIVPDTDLCVNLDYTRDNGRQWFNIQHCLKFNGSQVNNTVFLDIGRVASIFDLQTGLVHLRLTFCLLSRPGICSNHMVLENPKIDNFTTQTVILIIAVICFLLIIILVVLFILCCIRLKYPCCIYCCKNKYQRSKITNSRSNVNNRIPKQDMMINDDDTQDDTTNPMSLSQNYCSSLNGCSTPHLLKNQAIPRDHSNMYSSFTCQHQTQPPIYYEGSSFLQPMFSWPHTINPQSYEASSSNSHSSAGSSSNRTNNPKSCLKYRMKQDNISNKVVVNNKSLLELNEKIQLPDVTSEAIRFVKSSDTAHVLEAVV